MRAGLDVVCLRSGRNRRRKVEGTIHSCDGRRGTSGSLNARRRGPCQPANSSSACSAAAVTRSPASPPARRWAIATDLLVRAGASIMFSGEHRVRDSIAFHRRTSHPPSPRRDRPQIAWYDAYLQSAAVDRSANTTPGNKAGGLSTSSKNRHRLHRQVGSRRHPPVCWRRARSCAGWPDYAATPASDFICGTLQLAAGMNLHVFTHRPRHAHGLAACPWSGRHPQATWRAAGTT